MAGHLSKAIVPFCRKVSIGKDDMFWRPQTLGSKAQPRFMCAPSVGKVAGTELNIVSRRGGGGVQQ